MHFSKSFQGSEWAITMHPVSIESTLLLFLLIQDFLFEIQCYTHCTDFILEWMYPSWTRFLEKSEQVDQIMKEIFSCWSKSVRFRIRSICCGYAHLLQVINHEKAEIFWSFFILLFMSWGDSVVFKLGPLMKGRSPILYYIFLLFTSFQLTFNCSKSTIKTLEKGVKYVQS